MITKDMLKKYANLLMFDMNEEEYDTLEEEFKTILKQMDYIGKIDGIDKIEPMTFPFELDSASLREDEVGDYLTVDEVLSNTKQEVDNQVKVPKVVDSDV
jgi:aspartyl/glutamyl-tRNA(Asn/Gln) amidotransferase C subunit